MGFQTTLLTAVAELLHAENVGRWQPTGAYAPADTAIGIDEFASTADRGIALALYAVDDNSGGTDSTIGLQVHMRGAPKIRTSVKDISDRVFDVLHDRKNTELGGIHIVRIYRQSEANLGVDGNGRQETSANYYIQHTRPGANRTD